MSSEHAWPDEVFESRGIGAGYDSMRMLIGGNPGSSSAMLESLQSQLKQKEVIFFGFGFVFERG